MTPLIPNRGVAPCSSWSKVLEISSNTGL